MSLLSLFKGQDKSFDVSSVSYKKPIDEQLINKIINYLQRLPKVMVGISEDINSIVMGALLKQALGEKVIAMIVDFGNETTTTLVDICTKLNLNTYVLKRGAAYQAEINAYHLHRSADISKVYQRFISYHLLVQADQMKVDLVDTIDKSTRLLGTRPEGFYGQIVPFYPLYKTEVSDLVSLLSLPFNLNSSGQSYQDLPYPDNLVLTFDKIDPILFLLTEKQLTPEEISQQFNIDLKWLKRLKSHIDKQPLKTTVNQFLV